MIDARFKANVENAYGTFKKADYSASLLKRMPTPAQSALRQFAAGNLDVAEFSEKAVDGRNTYAAYVPSTDSGDIRVVDARGNDLADGTVQDGNPTFDWA